MSNIGSTHQIERLIRLIRGHKVIMDADLSDLYGVETRVLVQAVKRNSNRFPADFMFQLSVEEAKSLRSQFVISKKGRGGRRYLSLVFTEREKTPDPFSRTLLLRCRRRAPRRRSWRWLVISLSRLLILMLTATSNGIVLRLGRKYESLWNVSEATLRLALQGSFRPATR
jgi:hypothetical protein